MDIDPVVEKIQQFTVETPSWGYGDSGTRFKVFHWPGAASNLHEKLEDAAQVNNVTGACPSVAIHIPWDMEDDWQEVKAYAHVLGLRIGAVNPNLFQEDTYRFGSLCHIDKQVRQQGIAHVRECIRIAQAVDSNIISLWLADGTNYPGQDSLRHRRNRLMESLQEIYIALPPGMLLLIEYKFFEPAFYSTDLPDWGTSLQMAQKLGPQAEVLVDTGHHPLSTNIAHIVAQLLDEDRLGGFHFNDRKYADDDLIVGSLNPFELFCIFNEIVQHCVRRRRKTLCWVPIVSSRRRMRRMCAHSWLRCVGGRGAIPIPLRRLWPVGTLSAWQSSAWREPPRVAIQVLEPFLPPGMAQALSCNTGKESM